MSDLDRNWRSLVQISDNQDSLEMDPQEHSVTRTIDEEAELEERADREREEGHQEQDDEEEDRDHEVMTAGSECIRLQVSFDFSVLLTVSNVT